MQPTEWESILNEYRKLPEGCRYRPATDEQLIVFEKEFGAIPPDYRRFLREIGGGVVGSEWIDGIIELADTHRKFLAESQSPMGWQMQDVFVIGWDKGGNPFGIERSSGRIVVEDHDFGGIHEMGGSFKEFLSAGLR